MKRLFTLLIFIAVIVVGYLQKGLFLEWIRAGGTGSFIVGILFVAIIAFFPVVPFIVVAGVTGAVFGTWTGTVITLTGAVIGAMIMFGLARFGFRDWTQRYLNRYPKAKEYESYFEKNAFLGILFVRVIPVIPSQAVNILSGVSLVPWFTFFLATTLGKLPSNLVFNLAGSNFGQNKSISFLINGVYFAAIAAATFVYLRRKQMKQEEA